ncbi:MAG: hypothetical protein NT001_01730 [Candidatus Woesearchaeota archaeon]|nr:hypothetical protein [Candidatus Woesearchaeota archaeon]
MDSRAVATYFVTEGKMKRVCYSDFRQSSYRDACSECNNMIMQLSYFIETGFPHFTDIHNESPGRFRFISNECSWGDGNLEIPGFNSAFPGDYLKKDFPDISLFVGEHEKALNFISSIKGINQIVRHELSLMVLMNKRAMETQMYKLFTDLRPEVRKSDESLPDYVLHPAIIDVLRLKRESPGTPLEEIARF